MTSELNFTFPKQTFQIRWSYYEA